MQDYSDQAKCLRAIADAARNSNSPFTALQLDEAADSISYLSTQNHVFRLIMEDRLTEIIQLNEQLEQAHSTQDMLIDAFTSFVSSGIPNPAPFCENRTCKCIDSSGWCLTQSEACKGFSPTVQHRKAKSVCI